jgi:hypothetical protein
MKFLHRLLAIAVLQLVSGWAHACLFAANTPPEGWYQWASALFAAEVTEIAKDQQKPVDVITARVVETFKGPDAGHVTVTVRVPSRHWASCKLERPVVGTRVLVAMNAQSDAMLVPLSAGFAEQLRAYKSKQR